MKVIEL